MNLPVAPTRLIHIDDQSVTSREDLLAVEEPLEIRLGYGKSGEREQVTLSVTMRTPGQDFELALGFLLTEGIIKSYQEVASIHYCETVKPEEKGNVVRIELDEYMTFQMSTLHRNFYTTSSCGICGKSSIDALRLHAPSFNKTYWKVSPEIIHGLPGKLSASQTVFEHTGGLHAVALFDKHGELISVREDVGRHNAFDKIVGEALTKNKLPFEGRLVLLSGRVSFELVQKAAMSGVNMIVAVGAPSSLAVNLAKEMGIALIGFTRNRKFNVYNGEERIEIR